MRGYIRESMPHGWHQYQAEDASLQYSGLAHPHIEEAGRIGQDDTRDWLAQRSMNATMRTMETSTASASAYSSPPSTTLSRTSTNALGFVRDELYRPRSP